MTQTAAPSMRQRRVLVVGLGSIDRGDDAIGCMVAARVDDAVTVRGSAGVRVVVHEDPTALVEEMAASDVVVIVDAMRSGAPAGTVTLHEVGRGEPGLSERTTPGSAGTHGLGVGDAIELARALDCLPDRVVVVGVEAVDFGHGEAPSAQVANAVPAALRAILGIVGISATECDEGVAARVP